MQSQHVVHLFMARQLLVALFILLSSAALVQAQTKASVTGLTPSSNATHVARDSNIKLRFSHAMSSATLKTDDPDATVFVHGSVSGRLSSGASLNLENSDTCLVVDPKVRFQPGEFVSVVVSGAQTQAGFGQDKGRVMQFYAATRQSDARFVKGDANRRFIVIPAAAPADYDGDGDIDLVHMIGAGNLQLLVNDGSGRNFSRKFGPSGFVNDLLNIDLDNDGIQDVVGLHRNGLYTYTNDGSGTFTRVNLPLDQLDYPAIFTVEGKISLRSGDLNGDGLMDLTVSSLLVKPYVLFNKGDGGFTTLRLPLIACNSVLPGDFDGDGDLDVVIPHAEGDNNILMRNDGFGNFTSHSFELSGGNHARTGDLDGDGDLDVLIGTINSSKGLTLWTNDGTGVFSATEVGSAAVHRDLNFGDLDGDGDLDVALACEATPDSGGTLNDGGLRILINDGSAKFTETVLSDSTDFQRNCELADLNGDGELDIIAGGLRTGGIQFWQNVGKPNINNLAVAECLFAGAAALSVTVHGHQLDQVTCATLTLPDFSVESLTIASSSATTLVLQLANGLLTTHGNYTVTLKNAIGQSTASLQVNEQPRIIGAECVYAGRQAEYVALPDYAPEAYLSCTTQIVGALNWRHLGEDRYEIEWDPSSSGSITRTYEFSSTCSYSTSLNIQHTTVHAADDVLFISTGATTSADVLANDGAGNLALSKVFPPEFGSAKIVNNRIEFTAPDDFEGIVNVRYEAMVDADCLISASLIVTVGTPLDSDFVQFVERFKDRSNGKLGLRSVEDVVVSPNGQHVYAAGFKDYAIVLFKRNAQDGTLEYKRRWRENSGKVRGLRKVSRLTISADGSHLYATAVGSGTLVVFDRDPSSGHLTFRSNSKLAGTTKPRGLAVSPDDKYIYVCASLSHALEVFERKNSDDKLDRIQRLRDQRGGIDGLKTATDVKLSPDGRHVYVAAAGDNAVSIFARDAASGMLTYLGHVRDGRGGVEGLRGANALAVHPAGNYLYVCAKKDNSVAVFERNTITGMLTFVEYETDRRGGVKYLRGPSDVSVSPDGRFVFASSRNNHALLQFTVNAADGSLQFEQAFVDGRGGVDGLGSARGIVVSPDSRFVYVAGSADNAIAVFRLTGEPQARDDVFQAFYADDFDVSALRHQFAVLTNDAAPYGGPMKITAVTQPAIGTTSISADGQKVVYLKPTAEDAYPNGVPDDAATSFNYTIENGSGFRSSARVTVLFSGAADLERRTATENAGTSNRVEVRLFPQENVSIAPNPTIGPVTIQLRLHNNAFVNIKLCDAAGHEITHLHSRHLSSGDYLVPWNGTDAGGRRLASGIYFLSVQFDSAKGQLRRVIPLQIVH